MLRIYRSPAEFFETQKSFATDHQQLRQQVVDIITRVRREGDRALLQLTENIDGIRLETLRVARETIAASVKSLQPEIRKTFTCAIDNVRRFHEKQRPNSWIETLSDGSRLGMQFSPIQTVGVYVPGGRAAYPSTVIMTVVPAQIAAVERIALASPPTHEGRINPIVLAVAGLLGINEIYAIGGAQAIAALAYGTESIV
ncbi:MAG TPA: histidinol dehydrogenase, partial [bacterium]